MGNAKQIKQLRKLRRRARTQVVIPTEPTYRELARAIGQCFNHLLISSYDRIDFSVFGIEIRMRNVRVNGRYSRVIEYKDCYGYWPVTRGNLIEFLIQRKNATCKEVVIDLDPVSM